MNGRRLGRIKRHALRQRVGWSARYRLDSPGASWGRCRVVDVSMEGAGLDLFGPTPRAIGDRLVVDLDAGDAGVGLHVIGEVRVLGEVRHARDGDERSLFVGLELVELARTARDALSYVLEQPRSA